MKKIALICLFAMVSMGLAQAQDKNGKSNGPVISFDKLVHDYGTIEQGADGGCVFTFTNTGNEPLILKSARPSCGCTTPSYTQKPVMPGKTGEIQVKYNTHSVGTFTKTVTVTSNATNNSQITLTIKGKVVAKANNQPQNQPKPAPVAQPRPNNVPATATPAAEAAPVEATVAGPQPLK